MKIFFVRERGTSTDSAVSEEAFKIFVKNRLHPVHIDESEVDKASRHDGEVVFVVEDLNSPLGVELSHKPGRLITPFVVLYLKHESAIYHTIPLRSHPLMSQCLRGMVITSTGFSDEKEKDGIVKKIRLMSGLYQPELDSSVTVLVCRNVLSEKSRVATTLGIPIVTKQWITHCWHKYQYGIKSGEDVVNNYNIPIFYNLQFCVSGITLEERAKVEKIVTANGGKYSGTMNRQTDILLSNGVVSPKTEMADSMDIAVVTSQWLHDSLAEKHALPFNDYKISAFMRDDRYDAMLRDEADKVNSCGKLRSQTDIDKDKGEAKSRVDMFAPITKFDPSDQGIENIQHLCNKIGETFLDDTTIFAVGFGSHLLRAVKRACTLSGAVFLNSQLDSTATQIIVGPQIGDIVLDAHVVESLRNMLDKTVSIDWLIDSMKEETYCETKLYLCNPFEQSSKRSTRFVADPADSTDRENSTRKHYKKDEEEGTYSKDKESNKGSSKKDVTPQPALSAIDYNAKSSKSSDTSGSKVLKYLILSNFDSSDELPSKVRTSFQILDFVPHDLSIAKHTCLVVKMLNTSEKILAAIASGLYIVKPSFLCSKEFTEETAKEHEWAQDLTIYKDILDDKFSFTTQQIMISTRVSRRIFHKHGERLFHNVSVLMMNSSLELESLAVILRAGGATIFEPTIDDFRHCSRNDITFVLVDLDKLTKPSNKDMKNLLDRCANKYAELGRLFKPKFVSHFICELNSSSFGFFKRIVEDDFVLPELFRRFRITYEDFSETL